MNTKATALLLGVCLLLYTAATACGQETSSSKERGAATGISLDDIIDRVETRYAGKGFSAGFYQTSTLKAMNITDSATGKIFVRRPGMMRWEYETPEPQVIVTDSRELWIYRPDDNQVMVGAAPSFFGDGKGAGFLSDMTLIRKDFDMSLMPVALNEDHRIKLVPKKRTFDVAAVHLTISRNTYDVTTVASYNSYDDETRFELFDYKFGQDLADSLFHFIIPEGAEVLKLGE